VTPEVVNIIDTTDPSCVVDTLPADTTTAEFMVSWTGEDAIGEIDTYTVFVSENGGVFEPLISETTDITVPFTGVEGSTYGFFCVAKDTAGNVEEQDLVAEATTTVVTANQPPVALCQDVTVPADPAVCSAASASVDNGSADPDGDPLTLSQSPAGPYALGETSVTLTVTDPSGFSDSCTATVSVVDTTAPTLTPPSAATAECASASGTAVALGAPTVSDACDSSPMITNDAPAVFPLGTTSVTWSATDASGNVATATQDVAIVDTTIPEFSVTVAPNVLWPPNHTLANIAATVTASDTCDASPVVVLSSVTSNEPDNGLGDGDRANDIQGADVGTDDRSFKLRAERAGLGGGRVYTIEYAAFDASGNTATAEAAVTVPHDLYEE
jgi:hypothetical protein